MPLLTQHDVQQFSSLLRNPIGDALVCRAMHLFAVDRMNALYDRYAYLRGPDFAGCVLRELGVQYEVMGQGFPVSSPFLTISNHPYGGIDGIVLADCLGHRYPDYKMMVNKILGRVEALAPCFIPVTPMGAEHTAATADSVVGVKHALAHLREGGALGLFPSGAVSDFSLRHWCVRDREWPLSVVRFIAKARVPIVPVHFLGGNSWLYYALGLIDWRVRMLRLPAELFNKRDSLVRIAIGALVSVEEQQKKLATHTIEEFGLWLRSKIYSAVPM